MKGTKVSMRGMSQNGVLVMIDGMSINNGYTGGANWASVPVNMIERIEIVRGAGSALYGSNAMGGAINIITKKTEGGQMRVGFGSDSTRYGDFYYGDKADKLFYSVNYGKRTTDGYKDAVGVKDPSHNTYGRRESEKEWYGLNLQYEVDKNNTALFRYQVAENSYGYYESLSDPQQRGERKSETIQFGWQGRYDDGSALNINLSQFDMDKYWTYTGSNYNPNPVKSREADVNYSWKAGDRHTFTIGASYKQDKGNSETYAKGITLKDKSGGTTETKAIYLQDDIKLSDATNLILGGRYDRWKFKDGYNLEGAIEGGEESRFSPKAALNYKANDVTNYYVSVGKAFNSPTLFNLSRLWPMGGASIGHYLRPNADLKPEKLTMYEAGVKFDLNEKTIATISVYQNDVKDMIDQLDLADGDCLWENVGKARIRGIEASVDHIFDDTYSAFVGYTFADSEIREYTDPTLIGNQVTTVPKHEFKFGVNYRFGY